MDADLQAMLVSSVSFKVHSSTGFGPASSPSTLGPIDAHVEEGQRTRILGQTEQGQVIYEQGFVVLDPKDDSVISQVKAAEVVYIVLPHGGEQRVLGISTFVDPDTGSVDHHELSF